MKNKKLKKRLIIIGVCLVLAIGIAVGVVLLNQNSRRAYVQSVGELNMSYVTSSQTFYGRVAESAQQKIMLSSEKKVSDVFVAKGDKLKKGDRVFQYDTRLLELSLEEKQLTVTINETTLSNEKQKLETYQNIVPVAVQPTQEIQEATLPEGATEAQAEEPEVQESTEKTYTAQEKEDLIAEQEIAVSRAQTALDSAKAELTQAQTELDEAVVTAKLDGVVSEIQDPEKADYTAPFCVIVGNTGVTVKGYVGEFDYKNMHVGDSLMIQSFISGAMTDGEVMSVSDYPVDTQMNIEGNQNTSYYEFTAFVTQSTGFDIGEDVQIMKTVSDDEGETNDVIVLSKAYVRTDSKGSYVLKDVDGKLKRQDVTAKKGTDSESIQILDGLTMDDMIAFPYGSKGKEGLLTTTEQQGPSLF